MKGNAIVKDCAPQRIGMIRGMASMGGTARVTSNPSLVIVHQRSQKGELLGDRTWATSAE